MCLVNRLLILFVCYRLTSHEVGAETFSVKIATGHHVNEVDRRFLSFTVDPKYLFSSSEKYKSKECICMASSLTPAYIRIAGPSTSHMTFQNTTILFDNLEPNTKERAGKKSAKKVLTNELFPKGYLETKAHSKPWSIFKRKRHLETVSVEAEGDTENKYKLEVTLKEWKKFVEWVNSTGFDLVFALNNHEKTQADIWDPNTALNILTEADKADVGEIFWQLGYECNNQSIEEYLNDLETLRVIIETFEHGRGGKWRVVGGDVSNCLQAESKSDFKDYVTLSVDMLDAVMLNGNSSSQQLASMSETERHKLVKFLSSSKTPIWLSESTQRRHTELERAADWLVNLGYSARNGFAVHFRELMEEEMYQPTLSFYMALIYKNLVGERVLDVKIDADESILFAHCTSLRHKPVPGAVTFYGVNMDDEPARLSIKLSKREEGGDILQFVLGFDKNGNIVVNGRPMYYEGDIRPVVKRVRPYKTLLINLPPKSFGFWVLANTNIDACQYNSSNEKTPIKTSLVTDKKEIGEEVLNNIKTKRSVPNTSQGDDGYPDFVDLSDEFLGIECNKDKTNCNDALKQKIEDLQTELKNIREKFNSLTLKKEYKKKGKKIRMKRQLFNQQRGRIRPIIEDIKQRIEQKIISKPESNIKTGLLEKLFHLSMKINNTLNKSDGLKIKQKHFKNKFGWRNKNKAIAFENKINKNSNIEEKKIRNRRSILRSENDKYNINEKENDIATIENEVDFDDLEDIKLAKIIRKIRKQLRELPIEIEEKDNLINSVSHITNADKAQDVEYDDDVKENYSDDYNDKLFMEKFNNSFIKISVERFVSVLEELNRNFSKLWKAFTVME